MSSNTVYLGDDNGRGSNFAMRGFSSSTILRDGFSLTNAISQPELYNLEKIEVLKGPDSLQFGESNPGGLINLVKKKPTKETKGEIVLELNSNNSYSPKIDIGGSINEDGSARYRLVSVFKKDEGVKNYNNDNTKIFIAPTFAYDFNDNHTLTLISEYLEEENQLNYGTIIDSNGNIVSDLADISNHPDETIETKQKIYGFDFESNFDTWNSLLKFRHVESSFDIKDTYLPFTYNESTNEVTGYYASMKQENKENFYNIQ